MFSSQSWQIWRSLCVSTPSTWLFLLVCRKIIISMIITPMISMVITIIIIIDSPHTQALYVPMHLLFLWPLLPTQSYSATAAWRRPTWWRWQLEMFILWTIKGFWRISKKLLENIWKQMYLWILEIFPLSKTRKYLCTWFPNYWNSFTSLPRHNMVITTSIKITQSKIWTSDIVFSCLICTY